MEDDIRLLIWAEMNHLRLIGAIGEEFDGTELDLERATMVHDLNGAELFARVPFTTRARTGGYVDVARSAAFGEPILALAPTADWDGEELSKQARAQAREHDCDASDDELRFVAYSYPKLAVQLFRDGQEALLLELFTWTPIPPDRRAAERYMPPSNFERWSYLDEMPDERKNQKSRQFEERFDAWRTHLQERPKELLILPPERFKRFLPELDRIILNRSRELNYSSRLSDHDVCYELRGQQTNVWCVGASVQMLLDFYRYEYSQVRLASELGLGTLANPNGLPYSQVNHVVTVIEKLTSKALDATLNSSPTWSEFVSEINANRPLISIIPGHCRTVAGYTWSLLSLFGMPAYRGLLVYDPWPPNAGVVTRWENFNTQTYEFTYTARVAKV